jgi:uncharacterized protein YdeI (YjbR/CyaY-like superfamily)
MPRRPGAASARTDYGRFEPVDRTAWRNWLERNHRSSAGVWLIFHNGRHRQLSYDAAREEALSYGWIGGTLLQPLDDLRYMQLYTPRSRKRRVSR